MPDQCGNLQACFSQMQSGDTLIIRDGTYTGNANTINNAVPPIGALSAYTIIKAEHDGGVFFDGENSNDMFYVNSPGNTKYWQFEGLIWGRTPGINVFSNASYIKFLHCGAFDAGQGNNMNFGAAANGASYVLFENCYAWGTGRYKFIAGSSDHIVFRNCVARPDAINAGGEPSAVFVAYSANYVAFQNCIAIDADQTDYWTNIGDRQGAFFVPTTSSSASNISFDRCMGLNVKLGGIEVASNNPTSNIYFRNVALWNCTDLGGWLAALRNPANIINCTIGNSSAGANYCDGENLTVKNTIIYNNTISNGYIWSFMNGDADEDYNAYYGNNTIAIYGQIMGSHSITSVNPMVNSLKYLPRIESGSALKNAGENGSDIGANTTTLLGTPGTLYGEEGYDIDTGVSMWPFPNEDLIKEKMAVYNNGGVNGARGFAASGNGLYGGPITLTSYIWEYLGNPCPLDICNYGSDTLYPSAPSGLSVR